MRATLLVRTRVVYTPTSFADLVLWQVPASIPGSLHALKYRLAYVVSGVCVLRYDNEVGKGDHRHDGAMETRYKFESPARLIADFQEDIVRWNLENSDA